MMITGEVWRAFELMGKTWVGRWCRPARPGLIAGAATWGPTPLKRPLQGNRAWDCLRRTPPSYRVISANATVRVTPRRAKPAVSVRRAANGATGLARDTDFSELHGAAIEHQQASGEGA